MGIQSLSIFAMLKRLSYSSQTTIFSKFNQIFQNFALCFWPPIFPKILLAKIDAALCQQPKHLMYLLHMAHFGIIGVQLHFLVG